MNWKLVVSLSSLGLVMGIMTVLGLNKSLQIVIWIGMETFCAIWIAHKVPERRLRHGFVIGFLGGVMLPLTQAALFATYVSNNPRVLEDFKSVPTEVGARAAILAGTPIIGIMTGVGLTLGTWLAGLVIDGELTERIDSLFRRR
jgi:hypothetical protein